MPLAAYALVTLEAAKSRLSVVDDDRDEALEGLINEVSRAILQATGREYAPPVTATRTVGIKNGSSTIDLYPYEARSVSSVTIAAGTDDEYVVAAGDWQLAPITNPDGIYDRIVLASGISVSSQFGAVPVEVTGAWGWSAVPADVQGWVLEIVEDRWKQDFAFYADANGDFNSNPIEPASGPVTIPFRIRDEIEAAKRIRVGSV